MDIQTTVAPRKKIMTFTELCLGSVDAMGVLSHVDI